MKKAFLILGALLLFVILFFAFGFHTYFIKNEVYEELPGTFLKDQGSTEVHDDTNGMLPESTTPEPSPIMVATGNLTYIDAVHGGEGSVELIEIDGVQYVRFNDVEITNGPDLFVYVSDQEIPGNTVRSLGQYTDLGRLKGNIGTLVYELPPIEHEAKSVVIWCKRFGVLFTYATLAK